jgi:hypothetical protein
VSFDITSFLSPGPNTLDLTMDTGDGSAGDDLSLVVALFLLPVGSAPDQPAPPDDPTPTQTPDPDDDDDFNPTLTPTPTSTGTPTPTTTPSPTSTPDPDAAVGSIVPPTTGDGGLADAGAAPWSLSGALLLLSVGVSEPARRARGAQA